jgi:hypothetical protein
MGADAAVERHDGAPPGEREIAARMRAEGLSPHGWDNGPGDTYGWHEHSYEKVLYCVCGRIVFHTAGRDIELGPGDKMVRREQGDWKVIHRHGDPYDITSREALNRRRQQGVM